MKPAAELKVLREYLRIIEDPDDCERKHRRNARISFTIAFLFFFYCLSDNIRNIENIYYVAISGFLAGTAFGLGIWFVQAGTQTKLLIAHMAKESINERIMEITG